MLSSDMIAEYNTQVGGMIEPWSDDLLKPAAYELTLGAYFAIDGELNELTELRPWLELPSNSIVFVSTEQSVRLPHYIAARFDLAIEFIYQGILLGTGPQVDPGFQGYLSCPLHNISDGSVHMKLHQPFAKMDFAKTSGLRAADTSAITDERELYDQEHTLEGVGGNPVRLFRHEKRWRSPIIDPGYAGGRKIRSSVKGIQTLVEDNRKEVHEFENEFRRVRRFGLAAGLAVLLAIIGLLITLAQLDRSYTDAKIGSAQSGAVTRAITPLRVQLKHDDALLSQLHSQVEALLAKLHRQQAP